MMSLSALVAAVHSAGLMQTTPVRRRLRWGQDTHDQPTDLSDGERDQGAMDDKLRHKTLVDPSAWVTACGPLPERSAPAWRG